MSEKEQLVTMTLKRYEDLLQKEYLANSILMMDLKGPLALGQVEFLKRNYNAITKQKINTMQSMSAATDTLS